MEPVTITIEHRMGRSPVTGYQIRSPAKGQGQGIFLQEIHYTGRLGRTIVRLPSDPDDMLKLVRALLRVTHGELSSLALTTNILQEQT